MMGATMGRYAVEQVGARSIAVIDDRTAYGQGVADEFVKAIQSRKLKVVDRQFTNPKATDFTSILTSIKARKPDLIFLGGMDATAGGIIRQMKALGIQAKFMGGDGVCSEALPQLAGGALRDGEVFCAEAGGVDKDHEKAVADFVIRFKAKYHSDIQTYAPYAYDAVMVLAAAMQKAGSSDPAKYLPALQQTKYQGLTGLIQFDKSGDIANGAITVSTYKAGQKTRLDVLR
jgi:branched-chain amino acid transport system substrate-binding protein